MKKSYFIFVIFLFLSLPSSPMASIIPKKPCNCVEICIGDFIDPSTSYFALRNTTWPVFEEEVIKKVPKVCSLGNSTLPDLVKDISLTESKTLFQEAQTAPTYAAFAEKWCEPLKELALMCSMIYPFCCNCKLGQ